MSKYPLLFKEKNKKEIEKRRKLALEEAKKMAVFLKDDFQADKVILFGSVLEKERFGLSSDIDLAVTGISDQLFYRAYGKWIDKDLIEIEKLIQRIKNGWEKYKNENDELYLDSVALNLHSFYSGLEKIFLLIGREIDENIPQSDAWHQELLEQMTLNIEEVRPAVISDKSKNSLDDYRGFRHVVRNVYAYHYDPEKISLLIKNLDKAYLSLKKDIKRFLTMIKKSS